MKRKLLIIIPTPIAFKTFLEESSMELLKVGFEIHIVCQYYHQHDYNPLFSFHFLSIKRNPNIIDIYKLRRELRLLIDEINPKIIHAHFTVSVLILAISKRKDNRKYYATIQGLLSNAPDLGIKRFIFRFVEVFSLNRMDSSFVLTDDDYVYLSKSVSNLTIQQSKGFGVNLTRFDSLNLSNRLLIRKKYGIRDSDVTLIYIGRLLNFKGFDVTLSVFSELNKKYENVKLIVCGMEDQIRPLKLSQTQKDIWFKNNNIVKVGFTNELEKFLFISDINIFPSRREGLPVNIMESIAMGVPCVTSKYRGCRHVIMDNINGIIVKEYNSASFFNEIEKLIINPVKLNKLKEGCLRTRFLYDRKYFTEELKELYNASITNETNPI